MNRTIIILIAFLATISLAFAASQDQPPPTDHDTRVIYIVRHSEKAAGDNPPLSEAGIERTARLTRMLAHEPIAGVFVTQTTRSVQTGAPVAEHNNIETTTYSAFGYKTLRRFLSELPEDSSALVVAHSNTVSPILESLGAEPFGDIPDDDYTRLYAVILQDGVHTKTIRLSF